MLKWRGRWSEISHRSLCQQHQTRRCRCLSSGNKQPSESFCLWSITNTQNVWNHRTAGEPGMNSDVWFRSLFFISCLCLCWWLVVCFVSAVCCCCLQSWCHDFTEMLLIQSLCNARTSCSEALISPKLERITCNRSRNNLCDQRVELIADLIWCDSERDDNLDQHHVWEEDESRTN